MHTRIWLGGIIGISCLFAVVYVAVYQALRWSANDPQLSITQDTAAAVQQNKQPASLTAGRVDAEYNMAPFVIVYDSMGNVVAGNGYVDGSIPLMPLSVLAHAPSDGGAHSITWEPKKGVRIASVSVRAGTYYVTSGRSLFVVESHIRSLTQYMVATWLITVVTLAAAVHFATHKPKKKT